MDASPSSLVWLASASPASRMRATASNDASRIESVCCLKFSPVCSMPAVIWPKLLSTSSAWLRAAVAAERTVSSVFSDISMSD